MVGIYKITNKNNGKIYIGQSVHIERRLLEHKRSSTSCLIDETIRKEGKDNFTFEILEECNKESLLDREVYYINKYNSIVPYGYNVVNGQYGELTNYIFIDKDTLDQIKEDLKKDIYTTKYISDKYKISISTVSRINNGVVHYEDNEIYPLSKKISGKKKTKTSKRNICPICGMYKGGNSKLCFKCAVKNRKNRKISSVNLSNMKISREDLKNKIRTTPFTKIAEEYFVTDNAVRKWCKKYNLPYRKRDIKKFSDQEWENI